MNPLRAVYNAVNNRPADATYHDEGIEPSRSSTPSGRPLLGDDEANEEQEEWIETSKSRLPRSLQKVSSAVTKWVNGPQPPRPWKISPIFPSIQEAPLRLLDKYAPERWQRFCLLIALYFFYILAFVLVLHRSAFAADVPGYGSPVRISCGASFWSAKNSCGLDGLDCRPFSNDTLVFRCPANCINTKALNPHAVGAEEVIYKPVVIGGPTDPADPIGSAIYRGDSFICASAIHAGFINNDEGGCGVVSLVGEATDYPSVSAHGIESIAFPSSFPRSFSFLPGTSSKCKDLRWPLLIVSAIFSTILSLFTTSAPVFFFSIWTALFCHVALASDPPNLASYHDLISLALAKYLPSTFVMFVMYRYTIRRTLHGLTAQIEKTVLWLGFCWFGALNNYTFELLIPLSRLTPHDIRQQPGAIPALITVVLVIFFIALGQAHALRIEGLMPRYLALYGAFVFTLLMLVTIPGFSVRIHHYILALLLLPGTCLQTRPSLAYQGLLLGLFINGIARWGYDSILQTPGQMLGDGQLDSLLPSILPPVIYDARNITFSWLAIPTDKGWDGISVLVNDVERFRGFVGEFAGGVQEWMWERREADEGRQEFFRFGFVSGHEVGDYTKAGIWEADGAWLAMERGPSV